MTKSPKNLIRQSKPIINNLRHHEGCLAENSYIMLNIRIAMTTVHPSGIEYLEHHLPIFLNLNDGQIESKKNLQASTD
jgi:hypothetical protein